jgi:hypothetical protein
MSSAIMPLPGAPGGGALRLAPEVLNAYVTWSCRFRGIQRGKRLKAADVLPLTDNCAQGMRGQGSGLQQEKNEN